MAARVCMIWVSWFVVRGSSIHHGSISASRATGRKMTEFDSELSPMVLKISHPYHPLVESTYVQRLH
jgi:hypothetical protein